MGKPEFYVYRIFDGAVTVYVGKGSGRRLQAQQRNFRLPGEVIETCKSDDHAFERERHWIAALNPTDNISPGGNGGRCRPKPRKRETKFERELRQVGSRRYVARFLMTRINERNCERLGLSKVDLNRLRAVANGPRL